MKLSVPKGESPERAGVVPGSEASGKVANRKVRTEVSQTAVFCTDEQKPHTEAMRSDEVAHHAEVQHLERGKYRNSRCGRNRHKDVYLTEGGPDKVKLYQEVSRGHSSCG